MTDSPDSTDLDPLFDALAHHHRRTIIQALSLHPHSISQLAELCDLSLPAIYKHITVLEQAGMIMRKKVGRTNFLALRRVALRQVQAWIMQYHTYWGSDEETLENYLAFLEKGETDNS